MSDGKDSFIPVNDGPSGPGQIRLTKTTKITTLSGAGLSAESGIPTFRGTDGMWHNEELMKIATPHGFLANPQRSWEFYNERRGNMAKCDPNPAHFALAAMESAGYDIVNVTQNIDGLLAVAGCKEILELHGSVWSIKCSNPACSSKPYENRDVPIVDIPLKCDVCGAVERPNVVFFEEMLDPSIVAKADVRTKETDVFLIIGTSGIVYPAAGFAQIAKAFGAYVIELNLEPTPLSMISDETITGPCGETLPKLLSTLTGGEVRL